MRIHDQKATTSTSCTVGGLTSYQLERHSIYVAILQASNICIPVCCKPVP